MCRIIKTDGTELGITESVRYIKIGTYGDFVVATEEEAIGVAYKGTPYNLIGHSEIENADTVVVSVIDGGDEVGSMSNTINILLGVTE